MVRLFLLLLIPVASIKAQHHTIRLEKIAEGVYVHTSYKNLNDEPFPSNGLVIETGKSVVIVDSPWDEPQTQQLLTWIKKEIRKPVSHCIVTHSHDDRVTGTPLLRKKKTVIATLQLTGEKMVKDGYKRPDLILPEDTLIKINNIEIHTYFPGAGHSSDNLVVWLPEKKILFGGCFIKSVQAFGLGNIADANLKEWPKSLERVKAKFKDPNIIVPGHQQWFTSTDNSTNASEHTLNLLRKNDRE